jgi:hypothetical protein
MSEHEFTPSPSDTNPRAALAEAKNALLVYTDTPYYHAETLPVLVPYIDDILSELDDTTSSDRARRMTDDLFAMLSDRIDGTLDDDPSVSPAIAALHQLDTARTELDREAA